MTGPGNKEADRTRIGHLLGPHGVQGGVKLFVLGDAAQVRALKRVYVEGRGWLRLTRTEALAPGVVLHLAGVSTREGAEALRGLNVWAADTELPAPEDGVYYYHELRGLAVTGAGGEPLGEVVDVVDMGHQDLLLVRHAGGEAYLPLQAPYVDIRLNGRKRPLSVRLTDEAPEGLFDADEAEAGKEDRDGEG
ncbi:ribosome maturation factor RimM [Deinococcus ficus]|uniref:Ribosome maturation factor RimM n=1 Tax=Deinococcus ficus TaxID=317577 RepID=A0A221SW65_9DEIO|nr:ribosome maturation factor RimM [Deinococcus ficus]ASN80851.1 16S rRNA processing protein RimM [Deinococcus ficus]